METAMRRLWLILYLLAPIGCWAQEFTFRQEFDTIPVEIDGWRPFVPWLGGLSYANPDFADLDADGDLDLLIASGYPILYIANMGTVNTPAFVYSSTANGNLITDGNAATAICDIDNDGDFDLFATSDERVWFFENIGTPANPAFELVTDSLEQIIWWAMGLDLVDIDADGDFDLFTGTGIGTIRFYRNIGTPDSFSFLPEQYMFENISVGDDSDPCFCDIDADGDYDLFIGNQSGKIYFYRNAGTAQQDSFTYVTNYYNGIDVGSYASPEFADLDGDGDFDLLVG
ncbi:MAG: VCBS repeat-containing protein, partial [Candidatus Zixiibacteriota bacterium]